MERYLPLTEFAATKGALGFPQIYLRVCGGHFCLTSSRKVESTRKVAEKRKKGNAGTILST